MTTKQEFLKAIEEKPLDETVRLIFADWLDEHDEPEEANRQRQWVTAFKFLATFTADYHYSGDYDEDTGDLVEGSQKLDPKKVMGEIEWWVECVTGKEQRFGLAGTIGFATDYAADELEDEETRRKFWEAFYVITGVQAPEELRNQSRYRCAC